MSLYDAAVEDHLRRRREYMENQVKGFTLWYSSLKSFLTKDAVRRMFAMPEYMYQHAFPSNKSLFSYGGNFDFTLPWERMKFIYGFIEGAYLSNDPPALAWFRYDKGIRFRVVCREDAPDAEPYICRTFAAVHDVGGRTMNLEDLHATLNYWARSLTEVKRLQDSGELDPSDYRLDQYFKLLADEVCPK